MQKKHHTARRTLGQKYIHIQNKKYYSNRLIIEVQSNNHVSPSLSFNSLLMNFTKKTFWIIRQASAKGTSSWPWWWLLLLQIITSVQLQRWPAWPSKGFNLKNARNQVTCLTILSPVFGKWIVQLDRERTPQQQWPETSLSRIGGHVKDWSCVNDQFQSRTALITVISFLNIWQKMSSHFSSSQNCPMKSPAADFAADAKPLFQSSGSCLISVNLKASSH